MITIIALALIFAALLNIFSLRRKRERLNIFSQVTPQKTSILSIIESQFENDKYTFFRDFSQAIIHSIQINYHLLLSSTARSDKLKLFGMILLGGVAGLFFNYLYLGLNQKLVLTISLIGTLLVIIIVKKRQLKSQFYEKFPEALNTIIGVISSGSSISVSFNECATKIDGPIGVTMREICNRLEVGENANNVLLSSYRRLPFPEYYFFILTIMVNLDGGGELKEVLTRLSKMLTNNRILVKTRDSKTAELRMTVIILAAIPLAFILLLKVIAPDNYDYLINTNGGNIILYYVAFSVSIGIFFIKKMISKVV